MVTNKQKLIEAINDRFEYRDGGLFVKRQFRRNVKVGGRAGSNHEKDYRIIGILGGMYYEHRLVWLLHNGSWPNGDTDHINHDKQDNRIENLRDVSHSENIQNQIYARADNKLGVAGVCFHKASGKFCAQIGLKGKKVYLGVFDTAQEASDAYRAAKKHYHPLANVIGQNQKEKG